MATLKIGNIKVENGVLLAPMEDVTDMPFRRICKEFGADIVYSEFIASEAIVRFAERSKQKMIVHEDEHPVALQIFGSDINNMIESAKIIEQTGADFIDINYGCWVKNVVRNNAGSALLKEPDKMIEMTKAVVDAVHLPVTVKTRLGWDKDSIIIPELSQRLEQTGIQAITIHCRTRTEGHNGLADWSWIPKIIQKVSIPVILNGDVKSCFDVKRAFDETGCAAVMIGRAAIGNPFIFRESRDFIDKKILPADVIVSEKIQTCLKHLKFEIEYKGHDRAVREFRKHYSGYLKGLYNSHPLRQKLVLIDNFSQIEEILTGYQHEFESGKFSYSSSNSINN